MPGRATKAFLLRASPEVMAAVERLAAAELRSVNAQVEMLLREALSRRGRPVPDSRPPGGRGDDA
ncbi:MAG TPA: hypothetical protein VGR32_11015 [Brevundimonas sp.]|jgi:hypothetical protein|uniref:hypothetical protein n=1 Tax=Brevundimonas sp. TaxID=1871086 RepID=UPI002DE45559|nr:hypothetical protein [Brevundimonas sp.]